MVVGSDVFRCAFIFLAPNNPSRDQAQNTSHLQYERRLQLGGPGNLRRILRTFCTRFPGPPGRAKTAVPSSLPTQAPSTAAPTMGPYEVCYICGSADKVVTNAMKMMSTKTCGEYQEMGLAGSIREDRCDMMTRENTGAFANDPDGCVCADKVRRGLRG